MPYSIIFYTAYQFSTNKCITPHYCQKGATERRAPNRNQNVVIGFANHSLGLNHNLISIITASRFIFLISSKWVYMDCINTIIHSNEGGGLDNR